MVWAIRKTLDKNPNQPTNQNPKTFYSWEHLYKLVGWKDHNRIQVSESKVSVHCVEPEKVIQMMASGSGSITACEGNTNSVTEAAPHRSCPPLYEHTDTDALVAPKILNFNPQRQ